MSRSQLVRSEHVVSLDRDACSHARLSDKGIAKMVAHCRCGGRQGGRVRRRVHRRPACDGWIGQFRSLPL